MKVTLKQIAEKAGVSINTVSLALRDMPNVSPETRALVCRLAGEMGYYTQKSRRSATHQLCLLSTASHLRDSYFYMTFHELILRLSAERGCRMMVFGNEYWGNDPAQLTRFLEANGICGILMLGDMDESLAAHVAASGLPVVSIGARYPSLRICTYIEDNPEVAFLAVRHLVEHGCKRLGYIGDPLYSTAFMERYQGFRAALMQYDLSCDPSHLLLHARADDDTLSSTLLYELQQVEELPDAFFCANDYLCAAAAKALHELGKRVPNDVSLVGVDNSPIGKMTIPSLTTIDVHRQLQAELSLDRLLSFVNGTPYEPLRTIIPTSLVEGSSVAPFSD